MFKPTISTLIIAAGAVMLLLPLAGYSQDVFGPMPWWVKDNDGNMAMAKFRGISVVDSQVVWVVGENGVVYERTGTVHQHTWEFHNIPGASAYHLNDVCFVNAGVGWIVGEKKTEPNKYQGIVYKTTSAGATWDSFIPLPAPPNLPTPFLKVQMVYENGQYRGYISCGNGTVLGTVNGGASWFRCTTPWVDPAHPQDSIQNWYNGLWIDPNDAQELWVVGDAYGTISHSIDGGTNWSVVQTNAFDQDYDFPDPPYILFGSRLATYDLHFANANEGMIALSYGKLARTVNGGLDWNIIQLEPPADSPIWFKDVTFDDSAWLACGNFGIVDHYTPDTVIQENVNWRWKDDNYFSNFWCIDAASSHYAYAAGDSTGNVRQRYDPGDIIFNYQIADSGAFWELRIQIIDTISIRNFRAWYCTDRLNEHIWRMNLANPLTTPDTTYVFRLDKNIVPSDRLVYYELYLNTNDYNSGSSGVQEVALVTVDPDSTFHGSGYSDPPSDMDVTSQDTPNDQGFSYRYGVDGQTAVNWNSCVIHDVPWSTDHYYQGQAIDPTIGYRWYYDSTVQTGRSYTSRIFRIHSFQGWGFVEESTSGPVIIVDDDNPDAPAFVDTACKYDSATHTIKLVWNPPNPVTNPDIAGYWVCPIPPDTTRHILAHSAPISRTMSRLPLDTTWIGRYAVYYVAAMDYSGHISNWSESLAVYIGSGIGSSSSEKATAFNCGRKLCYIVDTDEYWTTFESEGNIYAAVSTDAGASWYKMYVGKGYYPALSYNAYVAETPRPALIWQGVNESGNTAIWYSRYTGNNTWTEAQVIISGASGTNFGPPSFAIGICDTGHVSYASVAGSSTIKYARFYLYNPGGVTPLNVGTGQNPSIGYMYSSGNPPIHVCWEQNNAVKYRARSSSGWKPIETPSEAMISKQPSIDIVGNIAFVVWAQNWAYRDIYWRYKVYSGQSDTWSSTKQVCSTPSVASTHPVLTGGYSCAWVEQNPAGYEIYFSTFDVKSNNWTTPANISDDTREELFSNYPHLTHKQMLLGTTVYFVWTEGSESEPCYQVKFKAHELGSSNPDFTGLPFYIVYGGESEPSAFNLKRDGYVQYGQESWKRVDLDNDCLEYQFETMDPKKIYTLGVYFYQHGSEPASLSARIDNLAIGSIVVPADTLIFFTHTIPSSFYSSDKRINFKIQRSSNNNPNAISSIIVLKEFDRDAELGRSGGKGAQNNGPQSGKSNSVSRYELNLTIMPSHVIDQTPQISYTVPEKGDVKIKIYDATGRLITKFLYSNQDPGIHQASLDIRDLARGVYFVKLETKHETIVRKAILIR